MKKILHIILGCFYKEGFGYQENILPVKHVQLGYEVHIITKFGSEVISCEYKNKDGVIVHALEPNNSTLKKIPLLSLCADKTIGVLKKIETISPDIIFIHGLQAKDNLAVCKYKKRNPDVKVYVDQHGDYYNMPVKPLKNYLIQKLFFKRIAKKLEKISEKMWGVTPWRVHYLQNVYNISPDKTGLLVMGGDEKLIDWENRANIRNRIRTEHNISDSAFLMITGGKIDKAKNIHLLIEAFNKIDSKDIHLIIFGSYNDEMDKLCTSMFNDRITNIGWINSNDVYPYFLASDLAVFPGTHSVLWEQVCAAGVPAIFKDWDGGMNHVDVGGNCILLKDVTVDIIKDAVLNILGNKNVYSKMKDIAETTGRSTFSYIEIAKKSIGMK